MTLPRGGVAHAETVGPRLRPLGDSITRGFRGTIDNGYRGPLYNARKKRGIALDLVGSQRAGVTFDPDDEGYHNYRIDEVAQLVCNASAPTQALIDS